MAKSIGPKLTYNFLGNSGLKVSNICLGAMTFGQWKEGDGFKSCTEAESYAILDRFEEWGGNFIDTANYYTYGTSEEIIGRWLAKKDRKKFIIATKLFAQMDPSDPNGKGLSRLSIMREVEQSLRRLRTDYIDLYQMHFWDDGVPLEETLRALNDLVRAGKVRYIGASNMLGWQLQKIAELCKFNGWAPVISLQQQYSLLCRHSELECTDVCLNEGIGMLPYSPLKNGWLSGKFKRGMKDLPDSRIGQSSAKDAPKSLIPTYQQFDNDRCWALLDKLGEMAKKRNKSVPQVALRWLLQKPVVSSVIIGARTLAQLDDNLGAGSGWELSTEEMAALDDASAVEIPYPYDLVALRWLLQKPVVSSVIIGARTLAQLDDNLGAGSGWELSTEEMAALDDASAVEIPYPYDLVRAFYQDRKRRP